MTHSCPRTPASEQPGWGPAQGQRGPVTPATRLRHFTETERERLSAGGNDAARAPSMGPVGNFIHSKMPNNIPQQVAVATLLSSEWL